MIVGQAVRPHGNGDEVIDTKDEVLLTFSSDLRASAEDVWARASTVGGMSSELSPLARLTMPKDKRTLTPEVSPLGRPAFRSWVLFLGLFPVDYDDVTFIEVEPGRRFVARSGMFGQQFMEHERVVEPLARDEARLTDTLRFRSRLSLTRFYRTMFGITFRHRHKRLRRHFGT
jgi:hypothetical protein